MDTLSKDSLTESDRQTVIQQKDALAFLDEIRTTFPNDNKVFEEFINIMDDFKSEKIGTEQVLKRATKLFRGHCQLIQHFVQFLPQEHIMKHDSSSFEIAKPSGDKIIVDSTHGVV